MLPVNKISGTSIASGNGRWSNVDDKKMGFVFDGDDDFSFLVSPDWMAQNNVEQDDLFDCIEQLEDRISSAAEDGVRGGLVTGGGYLNAGDVVRSTRNPNVVCVYTPVSVNSGECDGHFEWFLDTEVFDVADMSKWMAKYEKEMQGREPTVAASTIFVPTYNEACERTVGVMSEGEREQFLRNVWNYHKTGSIGYRRKLGEQIVERWAQILDGASRKPVQESVVVESDPSLKPPKKWFGKMKKKIKKPGCGEECANKIIGSIWYRNLSQKKKQEIRGREGKAYGSPQNA